MLPLLLRFSFCCLLLWNLLPGSSSRARAQATTSAPYAKTIQPGRLVVKLRPGLPVPSQIPALEVALRQLQARRVQAKFPYSRLPAPDQPVAVDLSRVYEVQLPAAAPVEAACQVLRKTGAVVYAEPLYSYPPLYQPNDPLADSTRAGGQYHLKNIRAYRAWDVTRGDTSLTIAIIDGGTRLTHEDLARQIQVNRRDPPDGLDNDQDGYVDNYYGWDFADNDNDPTREANSVHGILVAGCAAAAPDNGKGIAGVGFRCRFLPLKIYPSSPGTGAFAGYEAIVYAADHGCQVINLSWGGAGGRSQFEQDVITYAAINHDAVVIAAAGNTPADLDFYPASYDHVVSVATLTPTDERSTNATFSRRVDLSAPGTQILTTLGNTDSDYFAVGGSSFAAPLVAGAAGLVRTRFPRYTAAQVAAQLRRTTDNVDALPGNVAYAGRIGSGRLNVLRAVTEAGQHSARVVARTFAPQRRAYAPGDTLRLAVQVQNLLQPLTNLTVTLTSLSPHLLVRQGTFAAGPLATLERRTNTAAPFRLAVAAGVPLNTRAVIRYRMQDAATGYQEDQYETILLNPDYVVLDANNLTLTLTSRGNLGYDGLGSDIGEGVSYQQGAPLLAEGGLLVATSATRVSDNIRNDRRGADTDFQTQLRAFLRTQPLRADQEALGLLRDSLPTLTRGRTVGVRIRQQAYAWATAPHRDYVLLEYRVTNLTPDTLRPLHLGLFLDWDLPGEGGRNVVEWDAARRLHYLYDPAAPRQYAGVRHLGGGQVTAYALNNQAPTGSPVRLADGFSTAEKFLTLSNGTQSARLLTATDASQVTGAVLAGLAPADSVVVTFAVLAAPSLAQLQQAADAAASRYQQLLPTRSPRAAGLALYPNPTTGLAQLTLPAGTVAVQVLSAVGQVVATYAAPAARLQLDVRGYAAGVYIVHIQTPEANYRLRLEKR
ncbi:S8 family peptidase [Hymenobacter metallilatus]|uniref:T9SS C-terminal target domain-containing protein n=1 Tax=Hymenobacter metallilatus TaxID=2493666 RepID=A0A3R9NIQ8_9BACT|nr:S8 family peptidase [Hymenobacter metallilatus]RSK33899.1 T9SS C-terminal target domain-containing protein [Hymenobacter metallilatus]